MFHKSYSYCIATPTKLVVVTKKLLASYQRKQNTKDPVTHTALRKVFARDVWVPV